MEKIRDYLVLRKNSKNEWEILDVDGKIYPAIESPYNPLTEIRILEDSNGNRNSFGREWVRFSTMKKDGNSYRIYRKHNPNQGKRTESKSDIDIVIEKIGTFDESKMKEFDRRYKEMKKSLKASKEEGKDEKKEEEKE